VTTTRTRVEAEGRVSGDRVVELADRDDVVIEPPHR
jgi:hypothetical protein